MGADLLPIKAQPGLATGTAAVFIPIPFQQPMADVGGDLERWRSEYHSYCLYAVQEMHQWQYQEGIGSFRYIWMSIAIWKTLSYCQNISSLHRPTINQEREAVSRLDGTAYNTSGASNTAVMQATEKTNCS